MALRLLLGGTFLAASVLAQGEAAPAFAEQVTGPAIGVQSIPRIPRAPRIPQLRRLPGSAASSETEREPERQTDNGVARPDRGNADLAREYRQETAMLAYPINTNWSSEADNVRIEQAVAEYLERVDLVAGGRFDGLTPQQRGGSDATLRSHYDTLASTADREIAWALQKLGQIGVADSAYNDLLVLDAAMRGAVRLYPEVVAYQEAQDKAAGALAQFGSREGANEQKEENALAEARSVRMPPAIDTSSASVRQFRQAWATSGIPWTIRKIHITSGWGVRRNALGTVIGRTRDASIAAQDPETGRCNLYEFTMIIENGASPRRLAHSARRIACENIP